MPRINRQGKKFQVCPDEGIETHFGVMAFNIQSLSSQGYHQDVRIHCKNGVIVNANKVVLASSSKFLLSLFSSNCDCVGSKSVTFDLVCPSFEPEAVGKVLELISGLEVRLTSKGFFLHQQIIAVIESLQIEMDIPEPMEPNVLVVDLEDDDSVADLSDGIVEVYPVVDPAPYPSTQTRPFDCVYCSKRFLTPFELDYHVNVHFSKTARTSHASSTTPMPKIEPPANVLSCDVCGKVFSLRFSLDQHMKKHLAVVPAPLDELARTSVIKNENVSYLDGRDQNSSAVPVLELALDSMQPNASQQFENNALSETGHVVQAAEADHSVEELSQQIEFKNSVANTYRCHICKCVRSSYINVLFHIGNAHFKVDLEQNHDKANALSCRFCSKSFKTRSTLNCHFITDHQVLNDLVPPEDELRMNPSEDNHWNDSGYSNESKNKNLMCPLCSAGNFESQDLLKHLAMGHFQDEIRAKYLRGNVWQCAECQDKFHKVDNLIAHLMTRHNALDKMISFVDSRKTAEEPEITVDEELEEEEEELGALGTGFYKCPKCSKFSTSKFSILTLHIGLEHFSEQIESNMTSASTSGIHCKICSKSFIRKRHFVLHALDVHDGLKWFMTSDEMRHLEELRRGETFFNIPKNQDRYFKCPKCKSHRFSRFEDLLSHLARDHYKAQLVANFDIKNVECEKCTEAFCAKDDEKLVKHLALDHSKLNNALPSEEEMLVVEANGSIKPKSKLECRKCARLFIGYSSMILHSKSCFAHASMIKQTKSCTGQETTAATENLIEQDNAEEVAEPKSKRLRSL